MIKIESQFGEAKSLTDSINELLRIAYAMSQDHTLISPNLLRLEGLLKILAYHTTEKQTGQLDRNQNLIADIHCHECNKSWRETDACLLKIGEKWLCRTHHPKLMDGGIHPPGWTLDQATQQSIADAREKVFAKINRQTDLPLLNSRAGG